jgi:hypothetical protein
MTKSQATTPIPVQLSGPEFIAFIFLHLSRPRRGSKCKLGYRAARSPSSAIIAGTTMEDAARQRFRPGLVTVSWRLVFGSLSSMGFVLTESMI